MPSIAFSFPSSLFSTFPWPAALSSGQRRWRFPPCGTLPTASFLPRLSTLSCNSALLCFPHLRIFVLPLRRLHPSPPRVRSSGAGSGSSAAALQTFHIQLHIRCSRVALSGSVFLLSGGLPASGRPRVSKIRVHASFTQLQPLIHTSPAGRCATRGPGACGTLLPANGSLFGLARRLPKIQGKASSPRSLVYTLVSLPSAIWAG